MADLPNRPRGVTFDPTINLGHVLTAGVFLVSTVAAWVSLNARVDQAGRAIDRLERHVEAKVDRETVARIDQELSRRIAEQQQNQTAAIGRIDDGFREIKSLLRDLGGKLDSKADKPGR